MFPKLKLRIGRRPAAGFIAVCANVAVFVGHTVIAVRGVSRTVDEAVAVRTSVAIASTELVGHVHATLSALRGYILSGNSQGKLDRAALWTESETTLLPSTRWLPTSQAPTSEAGLKPRHCSSNSAIAFTPEAYPATKVMVSEVVTGRRYNFCRSDPHDRRRRRALRRPAERKSCSRQWQTEGDTLRPPPRSCACT
ncbi:hypothetical protein ML401_36425 (plasmid) [Bradyrhizobium sp. 62B]|uniref:CHASE3 domain-containing protein n=1 Tax=Bradyrhizobium sp. 62B TaxID=2898442 RepID=UPI002557D985|nr:hypothetical protein ML401_36425 [Bradyrhizobium sp. 62B]